MMPEGERRLRKELKENPQFGLQSLFPSISGILPLRELVRSCANQRFEPRARSARAQWLAGSGSTVSRPPGLGQGGGEGVCISPGQPEHASQGLLTTMDSSLASPSQLRAVHKLHRSHQLGCFLCPGEMPCVPRSTPPAIANCSHGAAIYRQSGLRE